MMQFIRNYLKSVASSQGAYLASCKYEQVQKEWVLHWKVSNYFLENGALFKYNKHTDRLNKEKTCKYIPSFLICSRNE